MEFVEGESCTTTKQWNQKKRFHKIAPRISQNRKESSKIILQYRRYHGATAFDVNGIMISSMEDVGRHNAMDKVTGQLVIEGKSPSVCVLSGRISYELVQKALRTDSK